jgi:hypothetical protein
MKMRSGKRIAVNLDELDQIIDRGQRAPLSQSDGQKLKSALHALAESLAGSRSTEKTRKVLSPDPTAVEKEPAGKPTIRGHGRNGAAVFTGAHRVWMAHPTLHSGDRCPECHRGKLYRQPEPATLIRFVGQAPLEATVYEMERLRCNAAGKSSQLRSPQQRVRKSMRWRP